MKYIFDVIWHVRHPAMELEGNTCMNENGYSMQVFDVIKRKYIKKEEFVYF